MDIRRFRVCRHVRCPLPSLHFCNILCRYVLFLRLDVRFKLEQPHVTTVLAIAAFHIVQVRVRVCVCVCLSV